MAELSIRTYGHIGSVVFALLGMVLPIVVFDGLIAELNAEQFTLFDALTGAGIGIYVAGLALAGFAAFRAYSGAGSKIFGILGGLVLLLIYGLNSSQISAIDAEYGSIVGITAGFGHYCVLIAAIAAIVSGFLPGAGSDME